MKEVIEFAVVFVTTILRHIHGAYMAIRYPDASKGKPAFQALLANWISALSTISIILFIAWLQPARFASIGINLLDRSQNFAGLVKGFVLFSFLLILTYFFKRLILGNKKPNEIALQDSHRPEVLEIIRHQDWIDRLAYLSVIPVTVIAEEFVYRGYLIMLLGNRTGSYLPWIGLSVFLSVIVHLYQGRKVRNILLHFIFAASLGAIVVLTQNLFASITAHLFNNLAFTANIWKLADDQGLNTGSNEPGKWQKSLRILFSIFNILLVLTFLILAIDLRFTVSNP